MAKVTILGDAAVVVSKLKLDDIKMVEKYRPAELVLKGGEDGKEEIFKIGTVAGEGSIGKYGASFGRKTRDEEEKAMVTICVDPEVEDVKEWAADKFGCALNCLNKLEEKLPEVLREIETERQQVLAQISVAQ